MQILETLCSNHIMLHSTNKTVALMVIGKFGIERPPIIKSQIGPLKFKLAVKYFGLFMDRNLKFHSHAKFVGEKAKLIMLRYAALCGPRWGVGNNMNEMNVIYMGSFVPIITYAAQAWVDELNIKSRKQIISAHWCALIRITKPYRTTSTNALEVLANVQPIMNELQTEKLRSCIRRSNLCSIYNTEYNIQLDRKTVINQLKANLSAKWQSTWQNSTKGRTTFDFFPNIQNRATKT